MPGVASSSTLLARPTHREVLLLVLNLFLFCIYRSHLHSSCPEDDASDGSVERYLLVTGNRPYLNLTFRELNDRGLKEHEITKRTAKDSAAQRTTWDELSSLRPEDWDVIWSQAYTKHEKLPKPLKSYHRINHIPGIGPLMMKPQLWDMHQQMVKEGRVDASFMPTHYILPRDQEAFLEAQKKMVGKRWMAKNQNHRGIQILEPNASVSELKDNKGSAMMIAEYVEPPLLIDGHKFDLGLFVAVTSLNPLVVWMYDDVNVRFCELPYPANGDVTKETPLDSYVVSWKFQAPWEIPDLEPLYEKFDGIPKRGQRGTPTWRILSSHLDSMREGSSSKLRQSLERIVAETVLEIRSKMEQKTSKLKPKHPGTFFELTRWDFVLDNDMRPFLNEINMSPDMSEKVFDGGGSNEMLKRVVLRDLMDIVRIGRSSSSEEESYDSSITLSRAVCASPYCNGCPDLLSTCKRCLLCFGAASPELRKSAREALHGCTKRDDNRFNLLFSSIEHPGDYSAPRSDVERAVRWLLGGMEVEGGWNPVKAGLTPQSNFLWVGFMPLFLIAIAILLRCRLRIPKTEKGQQ